MKTTTTYSKSGTHAGWRVRPVTGLGGCPMHTSAIFGATGSGLLGSTM